MATTYNTNITVSHSATLTVSPGESTITPKIQKTRSWASGTSADQSDLVVAEHAGVITNTGTPDNLDLSGGGLLTPTGAAASFVEVTAVTVHNDSPTETLTVGGGSNALAGFGGQTIPPGGTFHVSCGNNPAWAVTNSTADILRIFTAAGSDVPYRAIISGRSA